MLGHDSAALGAYAGPERSPCRKTPRSQATPPPPSCLCPRPFSVEAWRSLCRFEGRSRFSTWITRIAIHTCLGLRRRIRRLLLSDGAEDFEARASPWSSAPMPPDEGAAHEARRRAVEEILHQIGAKKRVVFVLAEIEGRTAPEIAEILDIPDATVRTRLFHARKELARLVRRHPGFRDLFEGEEP
jgi:RNA polymerase sigma factor (sigma-70 family)